MHLHRRVFTKYSVLQSLHKARPSTTLYCKPCTKYLPVLLCTTKLAQSTFQYYFARQSLHKVLPSTTLYYKACTKSLPVLLCTTKLAQSTSQYYFVLQSLHKAPQYYYFVLHSLHKALPSTTLYCKACTKHFAVLLCTTKLAQNTSQYIILCTTKLAQTTSQYYFVLQSLHKLLPSTTLYFKACANYFPVLLCTTKLAQSRAQYYFALQSLQKALPSNTLYYKACTKHFPVYTTTLYYTACTKHFPVLLCTTKSTTLYYKACAKHFPVLLCTAKLAQSTSQCYFVLRSLHKILPSTTLYYKACTNHFPAILCTTQSLHPVLLCTTKLAKSTSQYYFVLRSLHKAHPSTILYHKACTKYVPVLLCDTKLAQRKLLHTASSFVETLLHTASFLNREAFTHRSFFIIFLGGPGKKAPADQNTFWCLLGWPLLVWFRFNKA